MDLTDDAAKKDKFLQGVLGGSLTVIFFIAGAGVLAASGADGSGLGVGLAAAAGCAAVAYVAKLVIGSRT